MPPPWLLRCLPPLTCAPQTNRYCWCVMVMAGAVVTGQGCVCPYAPAVLKQASPLHHLDPCSSRLGVVSHVIQRIAYLKPGDMWRRVCCRARPYTHWATQMAYLTYLTVLALHRPWSGWTHGMVEHTPCNMPACRSAYSTLGKNLEVLELEVWSIHVSHDCADKLAG